MRDRRRRRRSSTVLQTIDSRSPQRRARVRRWVTRRAPAIDSVCQGATTLLDDRARQVAVVRASGDLDDVRRVRLCELVRELMQAEQFGRVAILAAMLTTGRHDA